MGLTPIQFKGIMDGLGEILSQKYDPDYKKHVKTPQSEQLNKLQAQLMLESFKKLAKSTKSKNKDKGK